MLHPFSMRHFSLRCPQHRPNPKTLPHPVHRKDGGCADVQCRDSHPSDYAGLVQESTAETIAEETPATETPALPFLLLLQPGCVDSAAAVPPGEEWLASVDLRGMGLGKAGPFTTHVLYARANVES